ncbi:helix-turn-helix transcriptional regulator [Polynucleobacter sp. AP-RePozz3-80-G7]|jgi:transcriptional regulator with XRE-family HTH domain|uniref:helix-turn-helix domain-containing protein n=1 Tax=Polynucleobacter sp. AP-RePozz3-80-G7 TaxID=2689105 RepID=UPI001C0B27DB|nr:helix-turn-helix transcriptional regulator [Polynucleobacter sp. AP-RePozz3-80-G7]MBU3639123.1 helix-turn-helix transcriptional regulator [Polynucleobacter sp. AP-RePozz3-80-G7]
MLERQKYELLRSELKNARLQAKMHQVDLAKNLKKPQSYISKVESGERNLDIIEFVSYCEALGLDASKWLRRIVDKF